MMHVDDADHIAAAHQRNGKKRLVGIFNQCGEALESRIGRGVGRQGNHGLVLGNPSGDALAHLDAQSS